MLKEKVFTRCSVTGARVTVLTRVCEVIDRYHAIVCGEDDVPGFWSATRDVFVPLEAATCQHCRNFITKTVYPKGG